MIRHSGVIPIGYIKQLLKSQFSASKLKYPYSAVNLSNATNGCRYFRTNSTKTAEVSSGDGKSSKPIQESLPKLPVPPLNETLAKYLKSVKPLLNEDEFLNTASIVKEFSEDEDAGVLLQGLLEEHAKSRDNWLAEWWLRSAYLEYRLPVPVFSSPGLVFPVQTFKNIDDQLRYAAKTVYGALKYKELIDKKSIPQDLMGKIPLDMSQYDYVFGTSRIPGRVRDELKFHPKSTYYIVAYKNYFHKVPAYVDGKVLQPSEILKQLKYIVDALPGLRGIPYGIMTSERRDSWIMMHEDFRLDRTNARSISVIDEALFLICIDGPNRPIQFPEDLKISKGLKVPEDVEDSALSEKQTLAAGQMLHGSKTNSGNRWFDKTIQFIVGTEGTCGLTYEHSPAEGPPIANMMDFILNNMSSYESLLTNFNDGPPLFLPKKLEFTITKQFSNFISDAKDHLDKLMDNLDLYCFTFKKYGKGFIKSCQLSPDSYIQMAIQAAFHKVHGIPGAHYESATTRLFKDGRTETIRSCSMESLEFCEAINSESTSAKLKLDTLKKAVEAHKSYAAQAVRGHGVDRHLLGLKLIAKEKKMAIPELFTDIGYIRSTYFRLSTSQVASTNQSFMCYGPLVEDGYGCCYNPRSNDISFAISSFNSCHQTNTIHFKQALLHVLLDMQKISTNV